MVEVRRHFACLRVRCAHGFWFGIVESDIYCANPKNAIVASTQEIFAWNRRVQQLNDVNSTKGEFRREITN